MKKTGFLFSILIIISLTVAGQTNLNSGLVAYYPFDGNVNDASGNNNNGFVYGATLTSDRFGNENKAYSFDGQSNYIITPVNSGFTTQISLCAWFKTTYNDYGGILCSRTATNVACDLTSDNNSQPAFHLSDGIATNQPLTGLSTTESVNDNNWHLLVGTYDGTVLKIYVDGLLKGQITNTFTIFINSFFKIGWDDLSDYNRYFNGKIDDVRIYNRAINAQEVLLLFNEANTLTSVSSISTPNISITSNSSNNSINVSGVAGDTEISIFEVNGKLIQKSKLTDHQLNVSNFHKGIYLVKLKTTSGMIIRKVVI